MVKCFKGKLKIQLTFCMRALILCSRFVRWISSSVKVVVSTNRQKQPSEMLCKNNYFEEHLRTDASKQINDEIYARYSQECGKFRCVARIIANIAKIGSFIKMVNGKNVVDYCCKVLHLRCLWRLRPRYCSLILSVSQSCSVATQHKIFCLSF